MQPNTDISKISEKERKKELSRRLLGRREMIYFTLYTFPDYEVNWHHKLICEKLDKWARGEITRLMIFTPPRYGKTELASRRLPAFILGKAPDASFITASYSAELAKENNRDVQHVIDSHYYNNLFPQTCLYGKNVRSFTEGTYYRNSLLFQVVGQKGRYLATGIGGGITGRGFTHGIIDDPIKNRADAESPTIRNSVYDWYTSTFYTRRESDSSPILIILTRWHEDDLAGRLLKAMKQGDDNADQWDVLDLQAMATEEKPKCDKREVGQALWPSKFNEEALAKIKTNIGSYDWSSLYQQRPHPPGGSKIKRQWFKVVESAPEGLWWVRFWDLAFSEKKGSSYTAGGLGAYDRDNNLYIKDVVRIRAEWPDVKKEIIRLALLEKVNVGVEQVGPMKGFVDELARDGAFKKVAIKGYAPEGNKLARALRWTPKAEAGKVILVEGHWNNPFLDEVQSFTGGDNEANDQVDMVSGLHQMLGDGEQQSLTVEKDHGEGLMFGGIMDEVF